MILQIMASANREIICLKPTRAERPAMCFPVCRSWGIPRRLSARLAKILSESCCRLQSRNRGFARMVCEIPTTLAFVHTKLDGDRDFSFYRNPGADMMLGKEEVSLELVQSAKIFHFGSLSMTSERAEMATRYAIETAKEHGNWVSFDPNLRPPLWKDLQTAKEKIQYGLSQCDILKISDNEVEFMTGQKDMEKGVLQLLEQYHIPLVCATMGKDGSKAFYRGGIVTGEPFHSQKTIETTGAGDTFCGCMLHFVLQHGLNGFTQEILQEMLSYANAAACLVTTKKGALRVMPSVSEIESFRKENR